MTGAWNLTPLLDRLGAVRGRPDELEALWASPEARLVVVDERGAVAGGPVGEPVRELGQAYDPGRDVLLGRVGSGDQAVVWFARRGTVDDGMTLRESAFEGAELEVITAATAVLAWHDSAGHCERCGAPSVMVHGGFQRHCTGCDRDIFPRTDPAMIVAVLDEEDRLLLAHQASWPEGRVSILAGFLEAGESGEHAVVREVAEESGLEVTEARFLSSQPWPYPRSLMLGFVARARGEVQVDGVEIAWATWYTRDELSQAIADGLTLPGQGSIAGRIVSAWREDRLPAPEDALRI